MHSKTNLSIDFIVFCGGKSPIDILIVRSHHIDGNENNWDVRHCIKTTKIVQNFYSVKYIINELCHCPIQRVDENMHYQIITLWIELVEKNRFSVRIENVSTATTFHPNENQNKLSHSFYCCLVCVSSGLTS